MKAVSTGKWIWFGVAAIAGGAIAALPAPEGLSHVAQMVLAITVFTAVVYDAAVLGSTARVNAGTGVNTTPKVVYWIDKGPPGIAP